VAVGNDLYPQFAGDTVVRAGVWRSKKLNNPAKLGYTCWRVESDFESAVTLRLYGDGVLVHTAAFTTQEVQRLPAGKWRDLEVEVEALCNVTGVALATSPKELA
jgi:hypothetical protein